MSRWSGKGEEGVGGDSTGKGGKRGQWCWESPAEPLGCCRVGTMSKVELAGRPEPGYERMDQFTVSVEHVAEMLSTIDFHPGEEARIGGSGRPLGLGVQTLWVGEG